jgi:site-specific DNA recombinase
MKEISTNRIEANDSDDVGGNNGKRLRAVIYLRVSTLKQASRRGDPEGYSLPAQREACHRKALELGADVVDEYIDRGESAKSIDRDDFQRMVERVKAELDVDLVILHKIDRFARNVPDDAAAFLTVESSRRQAGVSLREHR